MSKITPFHYGVVDRSRQSMVIYNHKKKWKKRIPVNMRKLEWKDVSNHGLFPLVKTKDDLLEVQHLKDLQHVTIIEQTSNLRLLPDDRYLAPTEHETHVFGKGLRFLGRITCQFSDHLPLINQQLITYHFSDGFRLWNHQLQEVAIFHHPNMYVFYTKDDIQWYRNEYIKHLKAVNLLPELASIVVDYII